MKKHDKADKPPQEPTSPDAQTPPAADQPAPPASDAMNVLAAERDDLLGRLQRVSADYLNYQKRIQRDIDMAREFANEQLMKELLTVLDDMDRALAAARENHDESDPLLAGMQLVHDKMLATLGRFGLSRIKALGEPFDPTRHLALMQEPSDARPQTVLRELQAGYELKGRLLRPAAVAVAKPPEDDEDSPTQ